MLIDKNDYTVKFLCKQKRGKKLSEFGKSKYVSNGKGISII